MGRVEFSERLLKKDERIEFKGKIGLVLSGGGARGSYQVGVWKALKDSRIEIGGVYGTSVGALNSVAISMNKFRDTRDLWLKINMERVVKGSSSNNLVGKIFEALRAGGFDASPLRESFNALLNEEAVRKSKIDMGIVAFSLTDMEPKELYIEDIPSGQLADYVLASANHPVFRRETIRSEKFIDGGVYRNIPVNMAINKGFKEIIVVDLGPKRLRDMLSLSSLERSEEITQLVITPTENYGDVLDFDPEVSANYMREGYLDCLKALGLVKGDKYYIHASGDAFGAALLTMTKPRKAEMLKVFGVEPWQTESTHHFYYGQLLPVLQDFFKSTVPIDTVITLLESMAKIAGLPQLTLYSIPSMMTEIASCDIGLFKGHSYNDIDVERIARLIKFAADNSVPEKLEGSQYRAFKEGFSELFPAQE